MGRLVTGRSGGLTRGGRAPAFVKGLPQRQGRPDWKTVKLLLRPSLQDRLHLPNFAKVKPFELKHWWKSCKVGALVIEN